MTFLTRYRPYRSPFTLLPRELDRMMDEAMGTMEWGRGENLRNWFPVTDVSETPEHLTLRLEVPGLTREGIKISVEDNMLTVRGEKKQQTTREDETFYRTERSYGAFERSFSLPSHFDQDDIRANLEDGVLTIRVPRREEAKAREISIEGGGERKEIEA